jgi:hypothetical protein
VSRQDEANTIGARVKGVVDGFDRASPKAEDRVNPVRE